jgi:hypothetical protein
MTLKYKVFKSILKVKTNYPILSCVKVKDGVAYASNLEETATMPVDLKDGMYEGDAFLAWMKDGIIPTDDGMSDEDFPEIPAAPEGEGFPFPGSRFQHFVKAISTDPSSYTLSGFLVDGKVICATDGRKMFLHDLELPIEEPAILPPGILTMGDCHLVINEGRAWAQVGDLVYSAQVLSGKFPNYTMFSSKTYEHSVKIHRAGMLEMLKVSGHERKGESRRIRITLEDGKAIIAHDSGKTVFSIDARMDNVPDVRTLRVNAHLFKECISHGVDEWVHLEYSSAVDPIAIDRADDSIIILMPMQDTGEKYPNGNPQHITGKPKRTPHRPPKGRKNLEKIIAEKDAEIARLKGEIDRLKTTAPKAKLNIEIPEGYPDTPYTRENLSIIMGLMNHPRNDFAKSLLAWVRKGREWTAKQYYYAAAMAV